jgi:NADH:ubiquinone oxidoreductase subunit K
MWSFFVLSCIFLIVGLTGLLVKRHLISMLISLCLMVNGLLLFLLIMSKVGGPVDGLWLLIFYSLLFSCQITAGFVLGIYWYQHAGSMDMKKISK